MDEYRFQYETPLVCCRCNAALTIIGENPAYQHPCVRGPLCQKCYEAVLSADESDSGAH